ncbi:MAG TPA: pyruvate kinase, partial [Verrucomicrobiales bacterium]|nr:pyruvate kinase [Verrucomicrobiales bacterium]
MSTNNELILTKIVATLGPASSSREIITELISEGVRVFRINFSHGELTEHKRVLERVRAAAAGQNEHIGVLGDLCGPKIRVGRQPGEGTKLVEGHRLAFIPEFVDVAKAAEQLKGMLCIPVGFHDFIQEARPDHRILLDDGSMELRTVEVRQLADAAALICDVIVGGVLKSNKGINFPDTELTVPAMTDH